MAITKVRPGGFALNTKLLSTEMSSFDSKLVTALDKSSAGDTLSGTVTLATGAAIVVPSTALFQAALIGTSVIQANAVNVVQANTANGIMAYAAGGIGSYIAGGINAGIAGGIVSGATGGISLTGGANDYPTYGTPRTRTIHVSPITAATETTSAPGAWQRLSTNPAGLRTSLTNANIQAGQIGQFFMRVPQMQGATLASVTVSLFVSVAHNGQPVPAALPSFFVYKSTNGTPVLMAASSAQFVSASGTTWYNAGAMQSLTFTATTANTNLDFSTADYYLQVSEEWGGNAFTGNAYVDCAFAFTNLVDMRPG